VVEVDKNVVEVPAWSRRDKTSRKHSVTQRTTQRKNRKEMKRESVTIPMILVRKHSGKAKGGSERAFEGRYVDLGG
jgi:hypothetical protein